MHFEKLKGDSKLTRNNSNSSSSSGGGSNRKREDHRYRGSTPLTESFHTSRSPTASIGSMASSRNSVGWMDES